MGHKHKYGVVLDAGSSGSRVYIYEYKTASYVKDHDDQKELGRLPKVKTKKSWNYKVKPGISTFGDTPELVGEQHLKELVKFAEETVPKDEIAGTPIFLLATAGMRLLSAAQREAVLESTCKYFQEHSGFLIPDCGIHVQVIPGETEGLYGWIAANYLLNSFDKPDEHAHGDGHHTYGFLDMGGASAQIAFAPNATESEKHWDDLKLVRLRRVGGEAVEYGVFVTTWLGFGADKARLAYVERLLEASAGEDEVPDPCLPKGLVLKPTGEEVDPDVLDDETHLIGTGRFDECLRSTYPLLGKEKPCENAPCLLNGVHTPAIDFDVNHFVGVSNFWHTTHEIFAMAHKDQAYDFQTYQKQVSELCSREWSDLEEDVKKETWGHKVDEQTVEEVCFKASWLINILHDGIGVPRVGLENSHPISDNKTNAILDGAKDRGFLDLFQAVNKIDDTDVSWTLGKMVLYASSQMPPANNALAVGFGSNVKDNSIPPDFQYASGKSTTTPLDPSESADWHDRLLTSTYSRRIPGLLLILLIIALALYLLCGRERRSTLWQKFTNRRFSRRKNSRPGVPGFGSKFFRSEPAYERVLEDAADPDDFELHDLYSDEHTSDSSSSSKSRTGRSSGLATPAARGMSPDLSRASPMRGFFDSAGGGAAGLGITPFERGGLIVRTESKERLAPGVGVLGRGGSPRRSPLVGVGKESVD